MVAGDAAAEAAQGSSMGRYTLVQSATTGSRPVYERTSGAGLYLFYVPQGGGAWYIGPNFLQSTGLRVRTTQDTSCPERAARWQVVINQAWSTAARVSVQCARGQ